MAYPSKRLLVCLGVVAGCSIAVCALLPTAPTVPKSHPATPSKPPAESPLPLRKVKTFDLRLSGRTDGLLRAGEADRYSFHLAAGQFLTARVEQDPDPKQPVDVSVHLFAPVNGKLFEIDSPTSAEGAEEIHLLAEGTGWHQAEVAGFGKPGAYRIQVQSVRWASPRDRDLFEAERLFYRGREAVIEDPKNSLPVVPQLLKAEQLARRLGRHGLRAEALRRASDCLYDQGKTGEALPYQIQALKLYQELGDGRHQIVLLNSLGDTYEQLGNVDDMERSYRRALQLSQKLKDPHGEATSWLNLADAFFQRGEFWKAIEACEISRPYWQRKKRWGEEVNALNLSGLIYTAIGEYTLALDRYRIAERMIPASDIGWRARIFNRYAEVLQKMGKLEEARPYAIQALILQKKAGNSKDLGVSLAGLGLLYQQLKDFQRARENQMEALRIFRGVSDARGEATAYINLGLLSLAEEKADEALRLFQQGLSLSRPLKFREGEAVALYGMAYAERMRGNTIAARVFVGEAIELLESLRKGVARDDLKAIFLEAKLSSYELLIDVVIGPSGSRTSPADLALSFETSERRRARSLLESLAFSERWLQGQKTADPHLLALRRRLDEEIDRRAEERRRLKARNRPTDEVDRVIRTLIDQFRSLETKMQVAGHQPSSPNRQSPVTLSEAQGLLDEDTVLLEYYLGRKKSVLWLVTPSSLEVFVLPSRETIEGQAREVYRLLRESQSQFAAAQALAAARRLSETVLKPAAEYLGKKRIVVVADGALHYVPFAFLPDPTVGRDRRPPYLIAHHEIVNLPSASVLREIRAVSSRRVSPSGLLAMVANPDFTPGGYPPLTQGARVTDAILDQVPPGAKTLKLEGPQASREMVTSGRLSGFRIVHFTTHGVIDTEIPELSGVVLSRRGTRDDYLRVRDIPRLNLPARLVVLSACNTALGKEIRGEGLVGLTHSFMDAGASTVVVSLWNVNEDSAPTFMRHFYHALFSEARSPAAALRSAQLAMIQDPQWNSPYYWAGFIVQGEWR